MLSYTLVNTDSFYMMLRTAILINIINEITVTQISGSEESRRLFSTLSWTPVTSLIYGQKKLIGPFDLSLALTFNIETPQLMSKREGVNDTGPEWTNQSYKREFNLVPSLNIGLSSFF